MQAIQLNQLIQDHDITSVSGVSFCLDACGSSESLLYEVIRFLRQSPESRPIVNELFDCVCYFYVDCKHAGLARLAKSAVRRLEGCEMRNEWLASTNGDLGGFQLSNSSGSQFAVFSPDASEPGRVRYTLFDSYGFFSHSTHDTYADALKVAWMAGFKQRVEGKLDELSGHDAWSIGTKKTALIQQVNLGRAICS